MNAIGIQEILLAIAQVRPFEEVSSLITTELAGQPDILLARIWLRRPGDICGHCLLRHHCPDRSNCLHLVASRAQPGIRNQSALEDTDGTFRRFPLNLRVIGRIGATGESVWLGNVHESPDWLPRGERDGDRSGQAGISVFRDDVAGVQSFVGHPLTFQGEIFGVLGVFCSTGLTHTQFQWLKIFADHAAIAINNARTLETISLSRQRCNNAGSPPKDEIGQVAKRGGLIGTGDAVRQTLERADRVAGTDATVLITGESGTGKSQLAKLIHLRSHRAQANFVQVNCGSITPHLFESEFFGHIKGSFTGALRDRTGRFQFADGGTLFLDEIAEIPLELQSKLLRVIQDGTFERVGEDISRTVNVRIIAATNRDLPDLVRAGRFREDLFFRLNVFPIRMPTLRERREDIPELVEHFLIQTCKRLHRPRLTTTPEFLEILQGYDWPGNIRELENYIERAVIISPDGHLIFDDLPPSTISGLAARRPDLPEKKVLSYSDLRELERRNLLLALERSTGKIYGRGGAAEALGIPPTTLVSRLKALGIFPRQGGD